jgi:hypothetical protein
MSESLLLFGIVFGAILLGITGERVRASYVAAERRLEWRRKNKGRVRSGSWRAGDTPKAADEPRRVPDAADQLRTVMAAEFTLQPLLNRAEARLFRELDRMVIARNPGWQVMAQVCVGEFLRCKDAAAFGCINSKRVDLLLMDEACQARAAIEYQGSGHHLPGNVAAARDAVKKEALRKAGIGYHEVVAGETTPAELRRLVEKLVPELRQAS